MEQFDFLKVARLVIEMYGPTAPDRALRTLTYLSVRGDEDGEAMWRSVLDAVVTLQSSSDDDPRTIQ